MSNQNQTIVNATYKRKPPFKVGTDLGKEVTLAVSVDVENNSTEQEESVSVTIRARYESEADDDQP